MQKQNLQTLKGFRDFLPQEKRIRDVVSEKIRRTFERYGFEPLETPTLEYADLLLGKYGNEADKLVYRFTDRGGRDIALRYDQTVPTARVLAQNQDKLGVGFRRYQIQNVFRADKPQRGRYREFTQCDADIFGISSPLADAEILAVYYNIYKDLGLSDIKIYLNDRETLITTLSPFTTSTVDVFSLIQSIDKLDKMDRNNVEAELVEKGITARNATMVLNSILSATASASLLEITVAAEYLGIPKEVVVFSPTLARGLDYYTGMIFEGKVPGESGSVGGGGRYDRLIESIGGPAIPAVGFGLGFDRTVEVLVAKGLVTPSAATRALVTIFAPNLQDKALQAARALREAGVNTELYPDSSAKLEKQLKYADKKGIPYAIVIGEDEAGKGVVTVKNLATRQQQTVSLDEAASLLQ